MKISFQAVLSVCFCGALTLTGAAIFLRKPSAYSQNENRYLQQRPELSAENIMDGTWQEDMTDYMSDQMPLRDKWTAMQAKTQILLGKKDVGGIYLGDEHRYFEKITEDDISRMRFTSNLNAIKAVAEYVPQLDVTVLLVPSAGTIQAEHLPKHAELYDAAALYNLEQATLGGCCTLADCRDTLNAHKDEYIYYRTDHHWTTYGAWFGYEALMQARGQEAMPFADFQVYPVSNAFYGTLYSKVLDADTVPDTVELRYRLPECTVTVDGTAGSVHDLSKLEGKDHYQVFFGGNYGEVNIHTANENGKSLLIFKDSYANSLVPYLLEEYADITMIDLRYNNGSWAELLRNHTGEVLFLYEMSNFAQDPNVSTMITALK